MSCHLSAATRCSCSYSSFVSWCVLRRVFAIVVAGFLAVSPGLHAAQPNATLGLDVPVPCEKDVTLAASLARVSADVAYLASDELMGRGIDSEGLAEAADYVQRQFKEAGLITKLPGGAPSQTFTAPRKSSDSMSKDTPPRSERNVLGILPGKGPHKDEVVILGAHYDHIGFGRRGPGDDRPREVHNGADDNASGTAVLMEVARRLGARKEPLDRTVLFIAFTGEERGLLGSRHYIKNPVFSLEKTVAMLNFDMVGRLRGDSLMINGTATGKELSDLLDEANSEIDLKLFKNPKNVGPSDQAPFFLVHIPAIHFFTGFHDCYHRPTDDVETLNCEGMVEISALVERLTVKVADREERLTFVNIAPTAVQRARSVFFGSSVDFGYQGQGYRIGRVLPESPAAKAGLKDGDLIVSLDGKKVEGMRDFVARLQAHKPGDQVRIEVRRGETTVPVEVQLAKWPESK